MSSIIKKPLFWLIALGVLAVGSLIVFIATDTDQEESTPNNQSSGSNDTAADDRQDNDEQALGEQLGGGTEAADEQEPQTPANEDQGDQSEEPTPPPWTPPVNQTLVDDWVYEPHQTIYDVTGTHGPISTGVNSPSGISESVGFSAGGAKDIDTFRRNIELGYLPAPTTLSHEGLFYDYFFETGQQSACNQLFCPNYATAVARDPFSQEAEYFLAVGLDSNIKASDFKRKKLNLVVVLDISGSMSSSFDTYYYDRPSSPVNDDHQTTLSKMEVANRSLAELLKHLKADDRLGIVLFNNSAHLAKDLRLVKETDLEAIKAHILEIEANGGTNMEAGYLKATQMLEKYKDVDSQNYENRIIFLTDAMPNLGSVSQDDLASLAGKNAQHKIYSSFIGIGLDFNTELIKALTQIRGANYFSVHSSAEFAQRLDEGFNYLVTPLVFDLNLQLKAAGYEIKAVYGSPEADLATGQIMQVKTLFPSLKVNNQTRGGLILLHLKQQASSSTALELRVSYSDRAGQQHHNKRTINFRNATPDNFAHSGVRKGIVLSRMVNMLQDWLRHEYQVTPQPSDYQAHGIPIVDDWPPRDSRWERSSQRLVLTSEYRSIIRDFKTYLTQEYNILKDETLQQEIKLLEQILEAPEPTD